MTNAISEIELRDQGTALALRFTDGSRATVPMKHLRTDVLQSQSGPTFPPPWAALSAEITQQGRSVTITCTDHWSDRLSAPRLADVAGLVSPDAPIRPDLVLVDAGWAITCNGPDDSTPQGADPTSRAFERARRLMDEREHIGLAVRAGRIVDIDDTAVIEDRYLRTNHPKQTDAQPSVHAPTVVHLEGRGLTPGLVDPHTHPIFAGDRSNEFAMRAEGADYLAISKAGGGIRSTMRATRACDDEELMALTWQRLDRLAAWGTTTIEAKSGYSLDQDGELRLLELLNRLGRIHAMDISTTLLAAHVVPPEYENARGDYLRLIVDHILPQAASRGLCDAVDVFCEQGAFSLDEAKTIFAVALDAGLGIHVHAEQFTDSGAAALAARMGALSADHLEAITDTGIEALAQSQTVAVLLPGAALTVGGRFPNARRLCDAGVTVALGTDLNPGTSMTESLPLMMSVACTQMGMSVPEAWLAVTRFSAQAIGRNDIGRLAVGARADLAMFDAPGPAAIPSYLAHDSLDRLIKSGLVLPRRPRSFPPSSSQNKTSFP
ncbi:MAG: imidazolonepropionase [Deltaproteobacteria bacterium]|nr:imidazolonepropionase [Deltaproteobacteria bacterium]